MLVPEFVSFLLGTKWQLRLLAKQPGVSVYPFCSSLANSTIVSSHESIEYRTEWGLFAEVCIFDDDISNGRIVSHKLECTRP